MRTTEQIIQHLTENTEFIFTDVSYKNDASDSIAIDETVQIYLPNTDNADPEDCESFDSFCVILADLNEGATKEDQYNDFSTLETLTEYLTSERGIREIKQILNAVI